MRTEPTPKNRNNHSHIHYPARWAKKIYGIKKFPNIVSKRSLVAQEGSRVCVRYATEIQCYTLVGPRFVCSDAQPLTVLSPLGSALIGKTVGQRVIVRTEYGRFQFTIISIEN